MERGSQEERDGEVEDGRQEGRKKGKNGGEEEWKREGRKQRRGKKGERVCFRTIEYNVFLEITIVLDFQMGVSFPNMPGILTPYHCAPVTVLFGKVNYQVMTEVRN